MDIKSKKLKQARLSFGQKEKVVEDKENIPLQTKETNPEIDDSVLFKSVQKQQCINKNSNTVEVQVDVHQTIQCPEVSTSSIESGLERLSDEVVDLTEDNDNEQTDSHTTTISDETSRNIDAVIDFVIKQGLTDADSLIARAENFRETRKRGRSPCVDENVDQNDEGNTSQNLQDPSDFNKTESSRKKARRSILDMLNVTVNEQPPIPQSLKGHPIATSDVELSSTPKKDQTHTEQDSESVSIAQLSNSSDQETDITIAVDTIDICSSGSEKGDVENNVLLKPSNAVQEKTQAVKRKTKSPASEPKLKSSRKSTEALKLKEDKEKEREEKRKQKEEEKRLREFQKLQNKRKREEERIQREEEKRKKKEELEKIKEEKLKKKQEEMEKKKIELEAKRLEKEKKEEEKRREREQKEAEKKAKEEERQKLLEEKAKLEDEKKRQAEKQAMSFKNFFTPSPKSQSTKKVIEKSIGTFVPFQLKEDMMMPPRLEGLSSAKKLQLDQQLRDQVLAKDSLYFDELKSLSKRSRPCTIPRRSSKLLSLSEDGVEICPGDRELCASKLKAKLLQFSENVRPPYYGTWRKRSQKLNPRNPFRKDSDQLDYEVDSDDEWEDVGEGEDIANSDGEEDGGEKEDEEDEADGFFVPHGYLSDDEGINDDEDDVKEDCSDQKLKMKQQEFENSFKQKIRVLVPRSIGCVWEDTKNDHPNDHLAELKKYEIQFFIPGPIDLDEKLKSLDDLNKSDSKTPSSTKKSVPDEAIPDLIQLLHGNPHSLGRIVPEFQEYWKRKNAKETCESASLLSLPSSSLLQESPKSSPTLPSIPYSSPMVDRGPHWISKTQLTKKIKEIGTYAKKENYSRASWLVVDPVFEKYNLNKADYPIPCKWNYITFQPDLKLIPTEINPPTYESPAPSSDATKGIMHKFTTKVSAEALLKQSSIKIKQEKEKQAQQTQHLDKYVTAKITPEKLLESCRQKAEQTESKKRRISLTTISLATEQTGFPCPENEDENPAEQAASFGVPTHQAFKSFFKVKEAKPVSQDSAKDNNTEDDCEMDCDNVAVVQAIDAETETLVNEEQPTAVAGLTTDENIEEK